MITQKIEYHPETFEEDLFDAFFALYTLYQDAIEDDGMDMFDLLRTLYVGYNKMILKKLDSHGK